MITFPADDVERDVLSYIPAIKQMLPGDLVTIFTPDDTHFDIAKCAIDHGCHVLLTKPAVMTLAHQNILIALAEKNGVHVQVGSRFLFLCSHCFHYIPCSPIFSLVFSTASCV